MRFFFYKSLYMLILNIMNKRIKAFNNETEKKFSKWISSILKENSDKEWNYEYLSENPNITWDIVKENPDKELSYTILTKDKEIFFEKEGRKYMAKYKIKIWLDSILLSPHTKWGKKHLENIKLKNNSFLK